MRRAVAAVHEGMAEIDGEVPVRTFSEIVQRCLYRGMRDFAECGFWAPQTKPRSDRGFGFHVERAWGTGDFPPLIGRTVRTVV